MPSSRTDLTVQSGRARSPHCPARPWGGHFENTAAGEISQQLWAEHLDHLEALRHGQQASERANLSS